MKRKGIFFLEFHLYSTGNINGIELGKQASIAEAETCTSEVGISLSTTQL